uniref:lysozyme n=1 Tax=Cyclina sinensis TaxID=120566 RepID=F6K6C5_CYCSN|nr:lysozyme [Cyclina sinensis]
MIVFNVKFLVVLLMIIETSRAATKTKCQVVQALRAQGVTSDSELRNWLCLVEKESSFRYDVTNSNSNGSKDYGIFQLNDGFWCGKSNGYSGTICWRLRTNGCQDSCSSFLNSDISNDANCAVRIKNCDGFSRWEGWKNKCKGKNLNKPKYDPSGC